MTLETIPARRGKAVRIKKGQSVKVVNTHGNQVVDFWAFNAGDLREYMGMEHCRRLDATSCATGARMTGG